MTRPMLALLAGERRGITPEDERPGPARRPPSGTGFHERGRPIISARCRNPVVEPRQLAAHGAIPDLVWIVRLSGGALMVGFSFVLGGPAPASHMLMTAALAASGVLVPLLIVGLSSPLHGAVTIPPDAYAAVLAEMRAAP